MSANLDNTGVFNNKEAVDNLVNCLSDRKLKPFPHIGVVGPNPHRENTSSIFTDSTQIPPYVVGYKVEVSNKEGHGLSVSTFDFTVRKALSDDDSSFDVYRISLKTDLSSAETVASIDNFSNGEKNDIILTKKETGRRILFEGDLVYQYIFSYEKNGEKKLTPWNLHIKIKKALSKSTEGSWNIETKFTNESDSEPITGDILELEADDQIPTEYVKTGYLMNIFLQEHLTDATFVKNEKGTPIRRLFNIVPEREVTSQTILTFRDYYIGFEKILKLKPSNRTIAQFIEDFNKENPEAKISPLISQVFNKVFKSNEAKFHKYQEEGIGQIWKEIHDRSGRVKVISVRTAGGKTETFMVPVIQYCIENLNVIGTKALVFYPTKALANDQAKRIFKALYFTNKELRAQGKRNITMALYHGDIEQHSKDEVKWVPFKCVNDECNAPLEVVSREINNTLVCPNCGENYDYVCVTRDESHRKLPDILITNPDTLTWVLSKNGERHSLLGRKIKYCSSCGFPSKNIKARKCSRNECSGSLIDVKPECVPELIIFDEVHLFGGAFGISVSQFLKRLNGVIKHYHEKIFGPNKLYKPIYVASTATIKDPKDFASKFFTINKNQVDMIPNSSNPSDIYEDISKSEISRYNLFILPRAYLAKQTTALAAKFLLDHAQTLGPSFRPRILGFANSLRDCNDLIAETRARYDGSYKIDGHNTQYDNEERSEREVLFNKGDVSVLYATSTLEVGVDFEAMHALIIFGPPYSFNDYLQRIGRAGRNSDAVVITVIKMNNPVDYFYYENCYELVSNPMNNTERVPISSYNPHVERKQVISTFFDYIQIQENAHDYDDYKFFNSTFFTGAYWKPHEIKRVKNYIKNIFTIDDPLLDEILEDLKDKIFSQADETPKKTLSDIFDHVLEKTEFTNLRSSDPVVEVDYIFGEA